jgi:hypothetical protein
MYERFTDKARKAMQLASQEAQRLNHHFIATEDILLGLVKEGSGLAAHVLKNQNLDLQKIQIEIEKFVPSGPGRVGSGKLPQTPRAKKAIEYSIEEASRLHHNYIGTEHLLLGLLREHEGVAAQVLLSLGVRLEGVGEEVLNLLGGSSPRLARRVGLWTRHTSVFVIFAGSLAVTLVGALLGNFVEFGRGNSGALIAGGAYVLAVAITGAASWAQKRFSQQLP